MSQVYSTEPQTTGRIILDTTVGPLDLNLFCKEAPLTCRSFLQLCVDGYYDNLLFHRIVQDFIIQTGEREKTNLNEYRTYHEKKLPPIDLKKRQLEIIPRIKFNHRGQLAWALPVDSEDDGKINDDMQSLSRQFFITMDEAPFLDKKYVIFGTIRGDTVFNALRIGKTETDGESGELVDKEHGPRIKSVRIESHIFDDIVATKEDSVPWKVEKKNESAGKDDFKKRKKKRKGKRDLNVLSFGADEEFDDDSNTAGMKSIYDLKKKSGDEKKSTTLQNVKTKAKKRMKLIDENDNEKKAKEINAIKNEIESKTINPIVQPTRNENHSISVERDGINETPKFEKEIPSSAQPSRKVKKETKVEKKMSALEARRMKYLNKGSRTERGGKKGSKQRDDDTLSKLSLFKTKMFRVKDNSSQSKVDKYDTDRNQDESLAARMARKAVAEEKRDSVIKLEPVYHGQVLEDNLGNDNETGSDWLKPTFKCKRHIDHKLKDHAIGGDGRNTDDYEVIDDKRRQSPFDNRSGRGVRNGNGRKNDKR